MVKSDARATKIELPAAVPQGRLLHLATGDLVPSRNNPRRLFDEPQLRDLKDNIREHGVLVPITVFKPKITDRYKILDGARRHRCCEELQAEGHVITIPANVVEPPTKVASLLFMFSIHNFREPWELMPTALALKTVIDSLGVEDSQKLSSLTGLSQPQIERCKTLLAFPEEFQQLSLDPDPKSRIPSNFWIELAPVLDLCKSQLPELSNELGRDGITRQLLQKYRSKKIKSVIHFRRIVEAFESKESEATAEVRATLKDYITDEQLETRKAFDGFIADSRRKEAVVGASQAFRSSLGKAKLEFLVDGREEVLAELLSTRKVLNEIIDRLERREDDPEITACRDEQ